LSSFDPENSNCRISIVAAAVQNISSTGFSEEPRWSFITL